MKYRTTGHAGCRALGHAWRPITAVDVLDATEHGRGRPPKVALLILGCYRCNSKRQDTIVIATGILWGRDYIYDPGYLYSQGHEKEDRPTRTEARVAYIHGLLADQK